jgi:hypothetical protein
MPEANLALAGLRYFVFAIAALVGPGLALQRLLRIRIDPALVLPLGFVFAATAYWASLALGLSWLFPASVLLVDLLLVAPPRRLSFAEGPSLPGAIPPFLALVAVLALVEYPLNRLRPDGEFVVDGVLPDDAAFHVGLAWELSLGYPPQVPGLSGFTMGYHLGLPLLRAAALRWAGVHPYDCLSRFDNTLGALALILALRACVRAIGGGPRAQALVGWSLLASDLSFLLAWGRGVEWWLSLLEASMGLLSVLHANSLVPAAALALGSLVALDRHRAGEGRGFLLLAALLGLAVPVFKVFLAAQMLLGLGAAALLARERVPVGIAALPLAVATASLALGSGGRSMQVVIDPFVVVRDARLDLGLDPLSGGALAAWALAWLVLSLGLRLAGIPAALRALGSGAAAGIVLAVMALSGWPLGLLFRVSPVESVLRERPFNESLYFFEQSGLLMWIFAAAALGSLPARGLRGTALLLACAAFCLPSTVQFLVQKARTPPHRMTVSIVRAMRALDRSGRRGDVVLQRPELQRFPPPPLVLVGRRVPYTRFIPFFSQFVPRPERLARFERTRAFFTTSDAAEAAGIARSLGASYVCLYGADGVAFETAGWLEAVYEEAGARVYRIVPGAAR